MPKFLETKLKKEYGANSKVPYKVMNKIGAMKGNTETPKGKEMQKKYTDKHVRGKMEKAADKMLFAQKSK